ncbi:DUF2189 domain-containing protein [Rhodocista pekingensis]|uniref:DUF2189 domain-containing protein n=1 Tax=Rhodocista pekingensis TaxID=201185 RepID=A0ABW2KS62_9PROT
MTDLNATLLSTSSSPAVRRIAPDRPWLWLELGFRDMSAAWSVSLGYGAVVTGVSWLLALGLTGTGLFHLLLPMCAGFMLVAPLAAVGLYESSRRLSRGEPVSLGAIAHAMRAKAIPLAYMGVVLLLFMLFWIRIATLLYALFFSDLNPNFDNLVGIVFNSSVSLPFLITGTVLGGVLASVVFAISAISIPMLMDRDVSVTTAISTSVTAVQANLKPMALWAFLIAFSAAVGMMTLFLGLIVALPLIGHATWHAYRDLVAD